ATLLTVAGDRPGDALDELADGGLALGCPNAAVEVLLDDDVRRRLRPGLRDLDVLLLEDRLPLLRHDRRGAQLPLDRVVRGDGRVRIDPRKRQSFERFFRLFARPGPVGRFFDSRFGFLFHFALPSSSHPPETDLPTLNRSERSAFSRSLAASQVGRGKTASVAKQGKPRKKAVSRKNHKMLWWGG